MNLRKGLTGIVIGTVLTASAPTFAVPPIDCPLSTTHQEPFPRYFGRQRIPSPAVDGGSSRPPRPITQRPGQKFRCPDSPIILDDYDLGETTLGGYSLEIPTDDRKTSISSVDLLEPIDEKASPVVYRRFPCSPLEACMSLVAEPDYHRMRLRTAPDIIPGPYSVIVAGRDTRDCDTLQTFNITLVSPADGSGKPPVDGEKPGDSEKPKDGEKSQVKCPEGIQKIESAHEVYNFDASQGRQCINTFVVTPPLETVGGFSVQQLHVSPRIGYEPLSLQGSRLVVPQGVVHHPTDASQRVVAFCPDAPGDYRLIVSGKDVDNCDTQLVRRYLVLPADQQRLPPVSSLFSPQRFGGHVAVVGGGGESTINHGDLLFGFGGVEGSAGAQLGSLFIGVDGGYLGKGFGGKAHDGNTSLDLIDHIGRLGLNGYLDARTTGFHGVFGARLGWLRENRTASVPGASFDQTTDAFEGNALAEFRRLGGSPLGFGLESSLLVASNDQGIKTFDYQDYGGRAYLTLDFAPVRVELGADITGLYRVEIDENLIATGPFARLTFPGTQNLTVGGFARFGERQEYGGSAGVDLGTPRVRASVDCRYMSESFPGQDRSGFDCLGRVTFGDQRPLTVNRINPL